MCIKHLKAFRYEWIGSTTAIILGDRQLREMLLEHADPGRALDSLLGTIFKSAGDASYAAPLRRELFQEERRLLWMAVIVVPSIYMKYGDPEDYAELGNNIGTALGVKQPPASLQDLLYMLEVIAGRVLEVPDDVPPKFWQIVEALQAKTKRLSRTETIRFMRQTLPEPYVKLMTGV